MIFSRRAIQRRLNELRQSIGDAAVDDLCKRLNRIGPDRLPAMWEVIVLYSLTRLGKIEYEQEISSGRRPDAKFIGSIKFIADIRTVSDEGLDKANPYQELSEQVEGLKRRLGLPAGGVELTVLGQEDRSKRGARTSLRIPDRGHLNEFVQNYIEPEIRKQITERKNIIELHLDDKFCGLSLRIDSKGGEFSSGSYPSYSSPTITDKNPVFNALREKARQLRGVDGLSGIFICDGGCTALEDRSIGWNGVSLLQIAKEFFRQFSTIDFVIALSFKQQINGIFEHKNSINNSIKSYYREDNEQMRHVGSIIGKASDFFPRPIKMPINARRLAGKSDYGWGNHGGNCVSDRSIKLSSREIMEVLAGRRSVEQMNKDCNWSAKSGEAPGNLINPFERQLSKGRLPTKFKVHSGEDENDDWIEIEFLDTDPAISPFR